MSSRSISSPIAESWSQSDAITSRASKGMLVIVSGKSLTREDLITNEEVICPVLSVLGLRTTIDAIYEHVEMFLHWARPRGKNQVGRPSTELPIWFMDDNPEDIWFIVHILCIQNPLFVIFCTNRCPWYNILYDHLAKKKYQPMSLVYSTHEDLISSRYRSDCSI